MTQPLRIVFAGTPEFAAQHLQALLDAKPNPTEHEVRHWLAGNLCRCTGYDKIVRAVLDAADQGS